jgi:hypothetical protein
MKRPIFITVAVIISCLFFVAVGVFAMSLGDVGKVCLFSPISGTITLEGKPVVNARLVRTGDRDGPRVDEAITNERGYFEFPGMFERTITKLLPMEFVASQKIVVSYEGQSYEMWSSIKRNPDVNTESRGKPLVVTCELTSGERNIVVDRVPIHGLCIWDVEPDAPENWDEL